ncbi:hypothetical protein M8J77_021494 [Diaphorina citri]|nr:hypothetical protein M8J77_021494 [Diaphorina citri]
MPANVSVYFSRNLAEEQNLLTRKYEFQLFQFKHLYKHLANDERAYELVCKQIDKNLSEFKKCVSYLKLPKCSLLSRNKGAPRNGTVTPSSAMQRAKVQPHLKQVPFLPSPVGSSFSDTAGVRTPNKTEQCSAGRGITSKHQVNANQTMQNRRVVPQSPHTQSQSQLNMSASMSSVASSGRNGTSSAEYKRDMIQSQRTQQSPLFQTKQHSHSQSRGRPCPSPQFSKQGRHLYSDQSQRSSKPLQRTESVSSILSMVSTTRSLNDSQSSLRSDTSSRHRMRPIDQTRSTQSGRCTPQEYTTLQRSNVPHERPTVQHTIALNSQRCGQTSNRYPISQKTNLLQMQRALANPQHVSNRSNQRITPGQTNKLTQANNVRGDGSHINPRDRATTDGTYTMLDRGKRNPINRTSQEQHIKATGGGGRPIQFSSSPFTKYRMKPQFSPASHDTPLSSSSRTTPSSGEQHRDQYNLSSAEQKPRDQYNLSSSEQKPREYRLVSPRASSGLSSSTSHTRQEPPYRRPQQLKTPNQSPVYNKQPTPPPFQETLKILTAAVKKSKI